jgi:hypothetical protein
MVTGVRGDIRLYSIRTGRRGGDDDDGGKGGDEILDPDSLLTVEEMMAKYGEEFDASVLLDEKVSYRRPREPGVGEGVI